jgi:pyruvate dehydrogenase kinase 2/3/4
MRRMLVSRISRRVLAEHHLALSSTHHGQDNDPDGGNHVGIIYTDLNVRDSIDRCVRLLRERPYHLATSQELHDPDTAWPLVTIDGHTDTNFAYIREHLE